MNRYGARYGQGQALGMGHSSGWENLSGAAMVPGSSVIDAQPIGELDEATLDDIGDQVVAQMGFFFEEPDVDALLAEPDDEAGVEPGGEQYGRRPRMPRGAPPKAKARMARRFARNHPVEPGSEAWQRRQDAKARWLARRGGVTAGEISPSVATYASPAPAYGSEAAVAAAPTQRQLLPKSEDEGTFTSSLKIGAGVALGFWAVGLGIAVLTGGGRK